MTRAPDTFADQRAASLTLHSGDSLLVPARVMGVRAMISYALDEAEHARRQSTGGGGVVSSDVLDLLLGLPVGVPVPLPLLTPRERSALRSVPSWAVTVADGHATRLAVAPVSVAPVSVELALVAARSWHSGLDTAGRFAPFCARAIVLMSRPVDEQEMLMQGDFYGVGVTVLRDETVEVLVAPAPFRRLRHTAAGWQFLERIYQYHR